MENIVQKFINKFGNINLDEVGTVHILMFAAVEFQEQGIEYCKLQELLDACNMGWLGIEENFEIDLKAEYDPELTIAKLEAYYSTKH